MSVLCIIWASSFTSVALPTAVGDGGPVGPRTSVTRTIGKNHAVHENWKRQVERPSSLWRPPVGLSMFMRVQFTKSLNGQVKLRVDVSSYGRCVAQKKVCSKAVEMYHAAFNIGATNIPTDDIAEVRLRSRLGELCTLGYIIDCRARLYHSPWSHDGSIAATE